MGLSHCPVEISIFKAVFYGRNKVSIKIKQWAFQQMVDEDAAWLDKQEKSLEHEHIKGILKTCVPRYYPATGQQNEALLAQVEELRGWIESLAGMSNHGISNLSEYECMQKSVHTLLNERRELLSKYQPSTKADK